jgi:hypothetical protein
MTDRTSTNSNTDQQLPGTEKDPADWVTGDEPMTGAQASYLSTLATETDAEVPDELTKAEASELIDDLRSRSERVDG